ncbi:Holliday junction resolvase RuvX [Neisseriaceae bacterium ESL0693]|nr:Holliday junction resolvase RuvX [Neisseriaceae bacterium ESL0693]
MGRNHLVKGTVLGFDFGTMRIGIAVGETEMQTAHPLETINSPMTDVRFQRIAALIAEWKPAALIVGLPTHADGGEDDATSLSQRFGQRLHGRFHLPVYWVDERWTSVVAEHLLTEAHVFGRKRKQVSDQIAAQAILQTFFDASEELPSLK